MNVNVYFLIQILFVVSNVDSARILGIFPLPWGSHYILGSKLLRGLAEAGHDVTMISPFKYKYTPKNGSWTDVLLDGEKTKFKMPSQSELFSDSKKGIYEKFTAYVFWLLDISRVTLTHPNVQTLLKSNATFDVVILEQLLLECQHIFAHIFNCPLILLSSFRPNPTVNLKVGCPSPFATIPHIQHPVMDSNEMTISERFNNVFYNLMHYFMVTFSLMPRNNQLLHEIFPDAPDLYDLYYNVSLVLLNSHPSLTKSVPIVPNMIEIGGYFIDPPKKLPQDLQEFLDGANEGVIYFSMGSQLQSNVMPDEKKQIFLKVFGKLKQKVLWKFENDLPGRPKNVYIKNWMPQQDILAHPNIKLFITQGGLLSSTEAIYHGIPLLVIPVFGDQYMNAGQVVQDGYGLQIPFNADHFTEETVENLIHELLYNPKYREVAQSKSTIFHDRPMTPIQTAVYWTEYVIRNKGALHLRVAGITIPLYKYLLLDLIGLVLAGMIVLFYIFKLLRRFVKDKIAKRPRKKKNE